MTEAPNFWEDDLLERQKIADFLHRHILHKFSLDRYKEDEALCFALDGEWGAGKSFFLSRWAKQLRHMGHPVVEFNAWENDLSEDPLMGFMAEMRNGLSEWGKELPNGNEAPKMISEMVTKFRRAFFPTVGAIARGYVEKKVSKEVIEGILSGDYSAMEGADGEEISKGLDKFLEKALDEHQDIKKAVSAFRENLKALVLTLQKQSGTQLPMFVIIDELDRCRPSYAIRLLEGIKHLFGAPNICFILSTNMPQIAESIRAIYGAGFDGQQYLRRFFAFEYELPTPSAGRLCGASLAPFNFSHIQVSPDLPTFAVGSPRQKEAFQCAFELVIEAFDLKPRSIIQVASIAEAAIAGARHKCVHALYLFFLAALYNRNPDHFSKIRHQQHITNEEYLEIFAQAKIKDINIPTSRDTWVNFSDLVRIFVDLSRFDMDDMIKIVNSSSRSDKYPSSLRTAIADGHISSKGGSDNSAYISDYAHLIRQAGYLSSTAGL